MNVEEFAKKILGFEFNEWQKMLLNGSGSRRIFKLPDRSGKTQGLMAYTLAVAKYYDGAKIVYSTRSQNAANQIRRAMADMVNGSPLVDDVVVSYSGAIQFKNGSTIEILHYVNVVQHGCNWDLMMVDDVNTYSLEFYERLNRIRSSDMYVIGVY